MKKNKIITEQRHHARVNAPALAVIDNYSYSIENWSIDGFKVIGFNQTVKTGDCFPIQMHLNLHKGGKESTNIQISTLVEVVWLSAREGKLGAQFLNLTKLEKDLLQNAIDKIDKGELTLVDQGTQISEHNFGSPQLAQSSSPAWQRLQSKRVLYTLIYLMIGGVLGFFSLRAVHNSLVNLQIRSAIIAKPTGPVVAPVESVVAKEQGVLDEFYVYEGMSVKPGQPLFSTKNDELAERDIDSLNQEIQSSRIELAEAQAALTEAKLLKQQEIEKLDSYQTISQTQLDSAQAEVTAETAQYQIEKDNLERFATLLREGAVSRQAFDAAKSKFAEAEAKLRGAQSQYKVAHISVASAQKGNFYDGDKLVSDLPHRTVEVEKRRQLAQIASQKVSNSERTLNQRIQQLQISQPQRQYLEQPLQDKPLFSQKAFSVVYKAPFSGSVIKVTKLSGNPVRPRETVVVLQREQAPPTIDAYLTPKQAEQIIVGSPATALIPAVNEEYQARVAKIDQAAPAPDAANIPPALGSETKLVYVQLALDNLPPEANSRLIAAKGMPVILSIPKQTNVFNRLAFWLK
jgi:multidrug resistance efflux pump